MSMPDNAEYLASLLHELCGLPRETEWVKFKCNNANPDEMGEYISALANAAALQGKAYAYVVWGVASESHDIVGTSFSPLKARKGNEELENWLLRLLAPRIHFRFAEFEIDGKPVSMIKIPRAAHRPVQFKGVEYIRIGSYKKKLKDFPEKERRLWRVFDVTPFEEQVAIERVGGSEVLGLLDYPSYFNLLNAPLPETRDGILSRLADDHMIAPRQDGQWDVLNLGAILFAADLTRFRHVSRKAVRVIEYEGEGRVRTKREYQGHKGYAAGFEGLIEFLKGMLPENEVIGRALRKTSPIPASRSWIPAASWTPRPSPGMRAWRHS